VKPDPKSSMLERQIVSNRYEIRDLIARGGMARVFRARDRLLGRTVALKVLNPEFASDPNFVERFRREAQAAASLTHPNIVAVYDCDRDGDTHYIAMEFVDGRTLRDLLKSGGRLHYRRAAEIAADIALALEAAHRKGVVHRDVKPGNIMLTRTGEVKVTDFGIARAIGTGEALTQAGAVLGTASYLSPEQADGRAVDPRSDVYSLGVVLYEMLTGKPPFEADSPLALALKHVNEAPTPPSEICEDIPASMEAITLKALSKRPDMRYQSALEMKEDLDRALQGRRVQAVPELPEPDTGHDESSLAEAEHRSKKPWAFVFIVGVLLALLIYGLYLLGSALGVFGGTKAVAVPNVIGKTFDPGAKQQLEGMGFKVVPSYRPSTLEETGRVLAQDPVGGSMVPPSSEVRLVIGEGPGTAAIPDVVGKARAEAEELIKTAGFKVGTVEEKADAEVEQGRVISQDPKPGSRVTRGTAVNLVVSAGPEKVTVPDVVGTSRLQAARLIRAAGLEVGTTSEEPSDKEAGIVIRQNPAAGSPVAKGSAVDLVVSSGPPAKKVPSVVGLDVPTATDKLSSEGFRVASRSCYTTDPTKVAKVSSQSPPAESEAEEGTTVTLVVAQSADPTAPPC
jgi:beta-lactam-binding protein with PASTA domain/predicted Ser/Thr protein kinase